MTKRGEYGRTAGIGFPFLDIRTTIHALEMVEFFPTYSVQAS